MKQIIRYILSVVLISVSLSYASAQDITLKADTAYANSDYTTALQLYEQALDSLGSSAKLYYNIGNSYYRTGNIPQAIIAYERALRLDPTMNEAKQNLEFVNTKVIDKPGERFTFLELTARNIATTFTPNGWAWIALTLFALFIAGALIYYFTSNITMRKVGFFGGITMLILSILSIATAFHAKNIATSTDELIITAKSTILSTSPRVPLNSSEEAMLLHEGTKLYLLDSVSVETDSVKTVWYDVKVDNAHRAWISKSEVERI